MNIIRPSRTIYKKMLLLFFVVSFLGTAGCGKKIIISPDSIRPVNGAGNTVKGRAIVRTARSMLGKPYKWGGTSPSKGFDCSGLVWWAFNRHGIKVPRVSWQQAKAGKVVHKSNMRAGDIVLFKIPGEGKRFHTGIYSGNGHFFIHSPKRGAHVREESMNKAYWRKYFTGARRIL